MQLVAYGAQDIYLTGNPQITFFKVVYRRHTNFSMEAIIQTWDGTEGGTSVARCTSTIARNGDLLYRMYLEIDGRQKNSRLNFTAASITDVELEIGGQLIDKQSGKWMNIWSHLTQPNPSAHVGSLEYGSHTGTNFQNMSGMGGVRADANSNDNILWVPLQFWFCRNPGLALPLIALQYHEVIVKLNHTFSEGFESVSSNKLWCDYIYLDTDERRRFAQVSHEYLIEQVQENSLSAAASASKSDKLNFNHPVKELIWVKDGLSGAFGTLAAAATGTSTYKLQLNGHDRFSARDFRYFTRTQIWQHHTGCGGLDAAAASTTGNNGALNDSIAVYSFALRPEEHQPSGTCNFSRIDDARMISVADASSTTTTTKIYAVNYNVLRIMSGMGGLAYSN